MRSMTSRRSSSLCLSSLVLLISVAARGDADPEAPVCAARGTMPSATRILEELRSLGDRVRRLRRDLHRHPERGNRERRTRRSVVALLRGTPGIEIRPPLAHTGIKAVIRGASPGPVVAWRADMDALPIRERTGLPYASRNDGVMHACGHDMHTAIAAGTALVAARLRDGLRGTLVFLFQPAEEGPPPGERGGAALMIDEGALADPPVEAIFGLHVEPGLDTGHLSCNRGVAWASVDNFSLRFRGRQGHAARPAECRDALLAASSFVVDAQRIVSRRIDPLKPAILHVGAFEVLEPNAPGRRNVVAGLVRIDGTVRTHHARTRAEVERAVRQLAAAIEGAHELDEVALTWRRGSPPGYLHPPLAAWGEEILGELVGADRLHHLRPGFAGEDFSRYLVHVPGMFFLLGVHAPETPPLSGLHTSTFAPDEAALETGMHVAATLLLSFGHRGPLLGDYVPDALIRDELGSSSIR